MTASPARDRDVRPSRGTPPELRLRAWQREAFGVYRDASARGARSVLWEATPGAGKTTAALVVCLHQLRRLGARSALVVVPTAHLKFQWARAAANVGIHLSTDFSRTAGVLPKDFDGFVVTYQQVAGDPAVFEKVTEGGVAVLDEVHHSGDGLAWGDAVRTALGKARFVLCLSGTPFRSDSVPIPFVEYDELGFSVPDYSYAYARAVEDGVCRPTAFFVYGGEVSWREGEHDLSASFSDELDRVASSRRLRAALDPASGWVRPMLADAHRVLVDIRAGHRDAAGLVVTSDRTEARKLARLLADVSGSPPVVVLSDDPESSARLRRFRDADSPWLVACNMVSEGVDVPRLRVGVYATAVRTKMYFRQFLGRIVRRTPGTGLQIAHCYLPADPHLRYLARDVEGETRHRVRTGEEEPGTEDDDRNRERPEPGARLWEALGSVNSGIDQVIVHGNQLALFGGADVAAVHTEVESHVTARLVERRSRSEEKASLAQEIRRLVGMYHKKSGKPHSAIHTYLNSRQNVRGQPFCTEMQLKERIEILKTLMR